jgi:segregation and condensation protein B
VNLKNKIEALLFLTDKPMKAAVIAKSLGEDVQQVRQATLELVHDYETRGGAIEIADEDGYMMQVKDNYASLADEFSPFEMPTSLVRTLSAIAIKQPVLQSEVIKLRGAGAYDHIKELLARDLIHKREDGRSPVITTTKKFQEYFRLSKDGQTWRHELVKANKKSRKDNNQTDENADDVRPEDTIQLDVFDANPNLIPEEVYFDATPPLSEVQRSEFSESSTSNGNDVIGGDGEPGLVESTEVVVQSLSEVSLDV